MISSSSTVLAIRKNGVCKGTLWRQQVLSSTSTSDKTCEFCVLIGSDLRCYESTTCYTRGEAPVATYRIVGAAAWNTHDPAAIRLVTSQGTHVYAQAPNASSRDVWLAALQAGLEQALLIEETLVIPLERPSPQTTSKAAKTKKYCVCCGALDGYKTVNTAVTPVTQYGLETRQDTCYECSVAQGVLDHLQFIQNCMKSAAQERAAIQAARTLCWKLLGDNVAISGIDEAVVHDQSSSTGSWSHIESEEGSGSTPSPPAGEGSWMAVTEETQQWIQLPATETCTKALLDTIQNPVIFGSLARVSPFLEQIAQELLDGKIGVPDFLEQLDEGRRELGSLAALKKQAFRVAGDMGSAMKLFLDHALPVREESTEILSSVLDFFLELCAEGELMSVSFFWPQLCHTHLRMLPPTNSASLARIDLVEDFLLTVASRYSVQLALDLIWSHTADLEESLNSAGCSAPCRRRRFSVLRFVCELESILFDFDGGWGGGSVSLGKMLSPTGHHVDLMKEEMKKIQELRKSQPNQLSCSARMDMLAKTMLEKAPEVAAEEKLRIARNAEYLSCHLNFTKRLSDIAEKLYEMDQELRASTLEQELSLLNSSGTMGGDPLNRVSDKLLRVVNVPEKEGHVFRSKERTPVLLLMEVVEEGSDADTPSRRSPRRESRVFLTDDEAAGKSKDEASVDEKRNEFREPNKTEEDEACGEDTLRREGGLQDSFVAEEDSPDSPVPRSASDRAFDDSTCRYDYKPSPRASALKRFDIGEGEHQATPKKEIAAMINSAIEHQLHDLRPPILEVVNEGELDVAEEPDCDAVDTPKEDFGTSNVPGSPVLEDDGSNTRRSSKRVPTLRNLGMYGEISESAHKLSPTGDIRREVLNAIMMRGIQGNALAAGTTDSIQRSLKELERKRATELLLSGDDGPGSEGIQATYSGEAESTRQKLEALGIGAGHYLQEEIPSIGASEEDEVLEAIRLLLIQNRVAQGHLSPADAAKVLQHSSLSPINPRRVSEEGVECMTYDESDYPRIDAGDVDPRLVGCGPLPPAVLQALTLWKAKMASNAELLELVKKDIEFVRHSVLLDEDNVDKLKENSAFWARFAFGERWAEKKSRIASSSPLGSSPGWDLVGVIIKANDDLRQEAFVMQLIELCKEAFELAGLELWVSPYRILATGRRTGTIEMVRNAMSFDALKKRPGYGKGGLREHLRRMTEFTADPGESFKSAQQNFVRSLAAYSLMSYFFLFKDRHNGNILLSTAGHVIHIDFGFVFGSAPGGSFSLEMSTPFKLTEEMLEVMGGLRSPLFSEFMTLFCCGFLALQSYSDTFLTVVEIMCKDSTFKCFDGRDTEEIVSKLRERFCLDLSKEDTIAFALDLIKQAVASYGTKQYDLFQFFSQGIAT